KAKYKGSKDDIVKLLQYIAEDVRRKLSIVGVATLQELVGRSDLLEVNANHLDLINNRGIDLGQLLGGGSMTHGNGAATGVSFAHANRVTPIARTAVAGIGATLNEMIVRDAAPALDSNT